MTVRRDRPIRRPHAARRPPFLAAAPPAARVPSCWEIHRESSAGRDGFDVYLDGARIGRERGAAELEALLAGARLRRDDVLRVLAALVESPVVWVEVRPEKSRSVRVPAREPRY